MLLERNDGKFLNEYTERFKKAGRLQYTTNPTAFCRRKYPFSVYSNTLIHQM